MLVKRCDTFEDLPNNAQTRLHAGQIKQVPICSLQNYDDTKYYYCPTIWYPLFTKLAISMKEKESGRSNKV